MNYDKLGEKKLRELLHQKDKIIENLMKEIRHLSSNSSIDCVTGVMSRRAGLEKLKSVMMSAALDNHNLTICFIDVDKFKLINDRFGHAAGDTVLAELCYVIRKNLREQDFMFRIGGDEFVIVFEQTTRQEAEDLWNKISDCLREESESSSLEIYPSASHGICEYDPDSSISMEELISRADKEMYKNKFNMSYELKQEYSDGNQDN